MTEKSSTTLIDRFRAQVEHRNLNDRALIEGPLARVAKDIRTYDQVARNFATQTNLLVALEDDEKEGLVSEHDELRGQFRQIFPVILTVGCAAFLQGHVQASINCASLYARWFECLSPDCRNPPEDWLWEWKLGAANASPFFAAAIIGAPSSLLLNFWQDRQSCKPSGTYTSSTINVFAFYSNTFFVGTSGNRLSAMGFSTGFAVNLFFAGVLTLVYPELDPALHRWGGLALFSALNLVAFVLVFLLVEETKGFSLEDLSMVFAVPKRKFVAFQLRYVGYLYRKYLRRSKDEEEPEFYTVALDHRRNNQPDASIRGGDESDMSEE
ncbi:hypothetical protein SLS64_009145 [Diaporthe eres]